MPQPLQPREIHVWRIRLDRAAYPWLPPTPAEAERAARFRLPHLSERYRYAHAGLRAILQRYTAAPLEFAAAEHGKPYLPHAPELKFNLAHSHDTALVAVALEVEVGVDVERLRPMPDCVAVAERFFPPADAAALADFPAAQREREFFRLWTRIEAMLKARGIGLYGAGAALDEEWTLQEIDAGDNFAAAVAALSPATVSQVTDLCRPML